MTAVDSTTRWIVQNTSSCAGFEVRNFGVRTVSGTVPITHATAYVDATGRPVRVDAELDLAHIDTGNARRDRDLAKAHLLDTGRFPTLTFHGGPGEPDGDGWRMTGRLAAHGQQIEVSLHAVRAGDRITATTSFDRADLGVRAPRLMIGRRIEVRIDALLAPDQA